MMLEERRRIVKPMNSDEKIRIWICEECLPNPVFVSPIDLETHQAARHTITARRNSDENVAVFG